MLKRVFVSLLTLLTATSCSFTTVRSHEGSDSLSNSISTSTDECVITIATTSNSYNFFQKQIEEFNSENNGYRIECRNYDDFYDNSKDTSGGTTLESFAGIDNQIVLDVVKGENIDIITDIPFTDKGKFNELVKKGAFVDLYQFLNSDEEINCETLYNHILQLNETNGKLETIPLFFSIDTLYGETKYVGEKSNWSFEELVNNWKKMPEDSTFNGKTTNENVYKEVLRRNLTSFVDIQNCKVNFNSPKFLEELKFINSFPPPEEYKTEPDYSVPSFISHTTIDSLSAYHNLFFDMYSNPINCTIVGYPSDDSSGSYLIPLNRFGITANSTLKQQKGAWLFIKKFLSYDFQYNFGKYYFPLNNMAFSEVGKDQYLTESETYTYSIQGKEYTGISPNYNEYCELLKYIESIKKIDTDIDNSIINVIDEEIYSMILDEKTPEKVASAIQNRVEILVSEKY